MVGSTSLSVIVPTPWASEMVAFTGLARLTLKFSVSSYTASLVTLSVMVCVATLAAKFSVPVSVPL